MLGKPIKDTESHSDVRKSQQWGERKEDRRKYGWFVVPAVMRGVDLLRKPRRAHPSQGVPGFGPEFISIPPKPSVALLSLLKTVLYTQNTGS